MFACCRREGVDDGTEGVDLTDSQNYPASSPRPNALFGKRKEALQTGEKDASMDPPSRAPVRGLPIAFREGTGGEERVVTFDRTPFGLKFQPEMPIRITEASGYAAELGVQPGWEVVSCGAVPLGSPNLSFPYALEVLRMEAELLECRRAEAGTKSVSVAFRRPGGDVATVNFTRAPLGIDFSQDVPLTVMAVAANGTAAELGVQVGWEVKSIGGVDVDDPQLLVADAVEVVTEEVRRIEGVCLPMVEVGIPVEFASGQTVPFNGAPWGFDISSELPLKVAGVKGQAAKLGVLDGWVLQSVGGARLDDPSINFADAIALVKSKVARFEARRRRSQQLRADGLHLLFGAPSGCVGLIFSTTPLGVDLSQSMPITVLGAKGQAAELGVEAGWLLLAVGGVSIAETRADCQSSLAVLEAMVERLRVQSEARKSASQAFDEA